VKMLRFLSIAILLIVVSGVVSAETIDFSTLPADTAVTNQYPGVVFSLAGGNDSSGSPTTGNGSGLLTNTNSGGNYPTAEFLIATFTTPATVNSFTFYDAGFNGANSYTLYNSTGGVIATALMSEAPHSLYTYTLNLSGVSEISWSNGVSAGNGDWWQGVQNLSFNETSATPEPGTCLMFGTGALGLLGAVRRRFSM